jgi:two-component system response regulator DesR
MHIRVLLAHPGGLVRGALAVALGEEDDILVVAETGDGDQVLELAKRKQPTIAVLDFDLPATMPMADLCDDLCARCSVLIVAERRSAAGRSVEVAKLVPRVGLIATESSLGTLVDGVRRMARGEIVLDSDLARTVLAAPRNPLSMRERDVLKLANSGLTTREIADKLFLSYGTVRNHLSRVLTKTGGRTRIEAIRIARNSGWF